MLEFAYDGSEILEEIYSHGFLTEDAMTFALNVAKICNGNMGYVLADMVNLTYGMAPSRPWTSAYYHQCSGPGTGAIVARIPMVTEVVDALTSKMLEDTFQIIYESTLGFPAHPTHRRIHSVNMRISGDVMLLLIKKEVGV